MTLSIEQACMLVRSRRDDYHERLRKTASQTAADEFRRQHIADIDNKAELKLEVDTYSYAIAGGMICC